MMNIYIYPPETQYWGFCSRIYITLHYNIYLMYITTSQSFWTVRFLYVFLCSVHQACIDLILQFYDVQQLLSIEYIIKCSWLLIKAESSASLLLSCVTWSFRNNSDVLICCSRNFYIVYSYLKQLCTFSGFFEIYKDPKINIYLNVMLQQISIQINSVLLIFLFIKETWKILSQLFSTS